MTLKAPFPYFGGKSRIAPLVWERFGDVPNYVEPFFGSGAMLLARPHAPKTETVNDKDALLANFWRALQADPEQVAFYADWPVNEVDLHARHLWLVNRRAWVEELMTNPEAYDTKLAGWWVWGISQWIGSGWCAAGVGARQLPHLTSNGTGVHRTLPHLAFDGTGVHRLSVARQPPRLSGSQGIHRKRPHVGDAGRGGHRAPLSRQIPHLAGGKGVHRPSLALIDYLSVLADRLRRVRVCCGDWSRVLGPSVTTHHGLTAVFLDPPYSHQEREILYSEDHDVAADVRAWAIENGTNPLLRIALCGYTGEHEMPEGWVSVKWKAAGGYGSQGNGRGRANADREVVWFSPYCRNGVEALPLFAALGEVA